MFKLTQLTSAVLLAFASHGLHAQQASSTEQNNDDGVEVIEVTGIRGSLNKAINIKRQEFQIVDAIVAEDIVCVRGISISVEAGVEHTDLAAGAAQLHRCGQARKASADDDDVLHKWFSMCRK